MKNAIFRCRKNFFIHKKRMIISSIELQIHWVQVNQQILLIITKEKDSYLSFFFSHNCSKIFKCYIDKMITIRSIFEWILVS